MAGARITIKGVAEARQAFTQVGDRVSIANLTGLLTNAIDLIRQDAARRIEAAGLIKSGALLASLQTAPSKSTTKAGAWTKAGTRHRSLVEFGHHMLSHAKQDTGKMVPPHPYFQPALKAMLPKVKQYITDGVAALVEGRATAYQSLVSATTAVRASKAASRKAKRGMKAARIRSLLGSTHHRL